MTPGHAASAGPVIAAGAGSAVTGSVHGGPAASAGAPDGGADPDSAEARAAEARVGGRTASHPISVRGADEGRVRVTDGSVSDVRVVAVAPTPPIREFPVHQGDLGSRSAKRQKANSCKDAPERSIFAHDLRPEGQS